MGLKGESAEQVAPHLERNQKGCLSPPTQLGVPLAQEMISVSLPGHPTLCDAPFLISAASSQHTGEEREHQMAGRARQRA